MNERESDAEKLKKGNFVVKRKRTGKKQVENKFEVNGIVRVLLWADFMDVKIGENEFGVNRIYCSIIGT